MLVDDTAHAVRGAGNAMVEAGRVVVAWTVGGLAAVDVVPDDSVWGRVVVAAPADPDGPADPFRDSVAPVGPAGEESGAAPRSAVGPHDTTVLRVATASMPIKSGRARWVRRRVLMPGT